MNPVQCHDVNRRRDQLMNVRIISPHFEVSEVLGEGLVQGQGHDVSRRRSKQQ